MGSGPGIFTFAYLTWLLDYAECPNQSRSIMMADGSEEFLSLFDLMWNKLSVNEKRFINVSTVVGASNGTLPKTTGNPDMIVFSNSLTEMLRDPRVKEEQLVEALVDSQAIVIVVDYLYERTSERLQRFVKALSPFYHIASFYSWRDYNGSFQKVNLKKFLYSVNINKKKTIRLSSNVEFVKAILIPRKKEIFRSQPLSAEVVMRYKEAWENHDLTILRGLFTNDALYQEKKDQDPFIGIDSICNYWLHNANRQTQVTFSPLFVIEKKENIRCLWSCEFYRRDLGRWMILNGKFLAEKEKNKLRYFRETFEKRLIDDK